MFRREQVVRPEMARLVRQFEGTKEPEEKMHHEQYSKFQMDFKADVSFLVDAFDQLDNPFLEESGDLIDLDQSLIMPLEVVKSMRDIERTGTELFKSFMEKKDHVTGRGIHRNNSKDKSEIVQDMPL